MLKKLKKSNSEGFTIIEVMIVLAIAALILLIVLLAVPALQRSARNTQRKNDVSAIAAALANYVTDNNGNNPVGLGNDSDTSLIDICSAAGASQSGGTACTTGTNLETAKVGYYKDTAVFINTAGTGTITLAASSPSTSIVTTDSVLIDIGYSCNDSTVASPTAQNRAISVFYATESGSGDGALQCVDAS